MWFAWHLKGAAGSFDDWLSLSEFDRLAMCAELNRRIEKHNEAFDDF